jgi:hypothetical protein
MYFTVVSIETIGLSNFFHTLSVYLYFLHKGFGDIQPRTTGARLFTCIFVVFGIVFIALTVGLMRETVLEGLEVGYRKRVQAMRQRRKVVRWKRRVSNRWREAVEWRLRESGRPVWVRDMKEKSLGLFAKLLDFFDGLLPWPTGDNTSFSYGSGFMMGHGLGYGSHPHGMHLNLEALSWKQVGVRLSSVSHFLAVMLTDVIVGGCGDGSRRAAQLAPAGRIPRTARGERQWIEPKRTPRRPRCT